MSRSQFTTYLAENRSQLKSIIVRYHKSERSDCKSVEEWL
jgi:hypothetical protein